MKVVINKCYGGFSLSPKALLHIHNKDSSLVSCLARVYYNNDEHDYNLNLDRWKEYLKNPTKSTGRLITVFSPCEKYVLSGGRDVQRDHPLLVECVETLGTDADGSHAKLAIIEIPDGISYTVEEHDGMEHIAEVHRTWS